MVCLQQLGLDVRLDRGAAKPWGFKLAGGAECNLPLTVVEVEAFSPATRAGLADGDEVLCINGRKSEGLTRAAVHDIIASTPLRLELYVIRTIGKPPARLAPSPFEPEAPLRTESPFQRPVTPYRPFSTEPISEIPPLEKPIILSPFYHDNFTKVRKDDFEPSTKFKLEKNKAYVPEDERNHPEVEKSYSAMVNEHVTTIEELNKELDLNEIETTAFEHKEYREDTIIEEVKIVKEMMVREQILVNGEKGCNVNATLLTQLLDQTADEISKKSMEIENKSVEIDKRTSGKGNISKEWEQKSELSETKSFEISPLCMKEMPEDDTIAREKRNMQECVQFPNEPTTFNDKTEIKNIKQCVSEIQKTETCVEEESKSAKDLIKSFEAKAEEENAIRSKSVERKVSDVQKEDRKKFMKKEVTKIHEKSEEVVKDRTNFEEKTKSFNEVKHHTISTANLLAEQRAYTLGLQTIPNIQGHSHSSYHYDLLLKTFFIHLTDVMVALSRIILTDGPSRSVTPMPQQTSQDNAQKVTQNVTQKNVNEMRTITETFNEQTSQKTSDEKKKIAAKMAQMKSEEVTQKMDAVISEFKKDSHDEFNENTEKSLIENKNEELDSVEITNDIGGKIMYVATVETKQVAKVDEDVAIDAKKIVDEISETALKEVTNNDFMDMKKERILSMEENIVSAEISNQIEKSLIRSFEESKLETHAKVEESRFEFKKEQNHVEQTAQEAIDFQNILPLFDARRLSQTVSPPKSRKDSTADLVCESSLSIQKVEYQGMSQKAESVEQTNIRQEFEMKSTTLRRLSDEIKTELEERRKSQDSERTPSLPEPVRRIKSRSSTSSEDSWVPVPETPLTDEYMFRLELPLEESKNPLPPSPPSEHEDPYTVKKSKLIPHIDTNIESTKLFQDLQEPRSPLNNTNGNSTREPGADPLTTTNASSNVKSVEMGTSVTRRRTANLEECLQAADEETSTILGAGVRELEETGDYVKHNCGIISQNRDNVTHHGGLIKHSKMESRASVSETAGDDNSSVGVVCAVKKDAQDINILNGGVTSSDSTQMTNAQRQSRQNTTICKLKQTSQNNDTNNQTIATVNHAANNQRATTEKYNCGIIAKCDGNVTHHGGLIQNRTVNIAPPTTATSAVNDQNTEKINCGIVVQAEGNVTHHGGLMQNRTVEQDASQSRNSYSSKTALSSQQTTENYQQTCESSTRSVESTQSESYSRIDVRIEEASEFAKNLVHLQKPYKPVQMVATADLNETDVVMTQHAGVVSCRAVTSSMMKQGEVAQVLKRHSIQNGAQNGDVFFEGTVQGIVDALDDPVVADEEVAKQLGKAGLTEEKIAELMSGESEMLKEAHVIGLRRVLASHMHRHNDDDDDDSVDFKKLKPQINALRDSEVLKALNDEITKTKEEKKREERKWTTFLQRPERDPVKNKWEKEAAKRECYKIKIVKQPKPKVAPDYKPQDFETGPLPWEERAAKEPPPPPVPREPPVLVPEPGPVYLRAVDDLPESQVPDLEHTGVPLPPERTHSEEAVSAPFESAELEPSTEEEPEGNREPVHEEAPAPEESAAEDVMDNSQVAEHIVESIQRMVDPKAPMEEQLAQMRAQLSALAELPGVISQTLHLVTAELARLSDSENTELKQGEVTVTEIKEGELATEPPTPVTEDAPQLEGAAPPQLPVFPELVETAQEQSEEPSPQLPAQSSETPTQSQVDHNVQQLSDECRIQYQKKELMIEMQFEHEQRQIKQRPTPRPAPPTPRPAFGPLVPQERPLVLPGGRRWRGPRDAANEDFIRETLKAQAEVIQGKAKGINFLKWEKPARTLEHLKDSSVYKLLHNLDDSPAKQVECLPPVVLAESEYRENKCARIREILLRNGLPIQAEDGAGKCPRLDAGKCPRLDAGKCPRLDVRQMCASEPEARRNLHAIIVRNGESPATSDPEPAVCPAVPAQKPFCTADKVCKEVRPQECTKELEDCDRECKQMCRKSSQNSCNIRREQCTTVNAISGPRVSVTEDQKLKTCPGICGSVLPEICSADRQGIERIKEMLDADAKTRDIEKKLLGERSSDYKRATELVVPPAPTRVESEPRPASRAEALEIIGNFVDKYADRMESRHNAPSPAFD